MCAGRDCPVHYFQFCIYFDPRREVGPEPEHALISAQVDKQFWGLVDQFTCSQDKFFSTVASVYLSNE